MCGPDCNESPNGSCWRLPPPKDISMYRPGKKKKKEAAVVTGHLHGSNKANHKLISLLATGQRPPIHNFRTKRASGNI